MKHCKVKKNTKSKNDLKVRWNTLFSGFGLSFAFQFCVNDFKLQGVSAEGLAVLARLNHVQRQQHLTGTVAGSLAATDRLMKELKDIYRSQSYKNGM